MSTEDIPAKTLERVRKICLALPEATEKEAWGHPTFRVRDKMFASIGAYDEPGGEGKPKGGKAVVSMTMKAAPGEQEALLAHGHPFFFPKYVGVRGWIGIVLDGRVDWTQVAELVEDSYREIAPKRLTALLD